LDGRITFLWLLPDGTGRRCSTPFPFPTGRPPFGTRTYRCRVGGGVLFPDSPKTGDHTAVVDGGTDWAAGTPTPHGLPTVVRFHPIFWVSDVTYAISCGRCAVDDFGLHFGWLFVPRAALPARLPPPTRHLLCGPVERSPPAALPPVVGTHGETGRRYPGLTVDNTILFIRLVTVVNASTHHLAALYCSYFTGTVWWFAPTSSAAGKFPCPTLVAGTGRPQRRWLHYCTTFKNYGRRAVPSDVSTLRTDLPTAPTPRYHRRD